MDKREFSHKPVLLDECMESLFIRPDGIYADCTAGGGGHSLEIAKRLGASGRLICLDRDEEAVNACKKRLAPFHGKVTVVKEKFSRLPHVLQELNITGLDGILVDLGVSSHQLDQPMRGFSYRHDAPLDMRMDKHSSLTAFHVVNSWDERKLYKILREYGEERYAASISKRIVREREKNAINTTYELSDIIAAAMPSKARREEQHPAKRSFQAIRIAVNAELSQLEELLSFLPDLLICGGRAAIITFHSLEDRLVKHSFAEMASPCECPPDFPLCVCNKKPLIHIITPKPIYPKPEEIENNPRARSAKLRVCERSGETNGKEI